MKILCCKDCKNRHEACHSSCELYLKEKEQFMEDKRKKFEYDMKHRQIPKGRFLGDYDISKKFSRKSI